MKGGTGGREGEEVRGASKVIQRRGNLLVFPKQKPFIRQGEKKYGKN